MKRLLSVIIAMAMILAMVPAVFAADSVGNTGVKVVYPFYKSAYDDSVATPESITYENSGYRLACDTITHAFSTHSGWVNENAFLNVGRSTSSNMHYASFTIMVPQAGTYDIEYEYVKSTTNSSPSTFLYVFPAGTTDLGAKARQDKAETRLTPALDYNSTTGSDYYEKEITSYTFPSAGEYILVWRNSSSNGSAVRPRMLTITGGEDSKGIVIHGEISLDKATLDKANSDTATVALNNVYMSDGSAADASSVAYVSSDTSVAKIEGNVVVPVASGTAKISAISGDLVIDEETITVTNSALCGVKAVYPFYKSAYMSAPNTPEEITYENSGYRLGFGGHNSVSDFKTPFAWDGEYALIRLQRFGSSKKNFYYKINVPKAGEYDLTLDYVQGADGSPSVSVYIFNGIIEDVAAAVNNGTSVLSGLDFSATTSTPATTNASYTFPSAGEYIVAFRNTRTTAQSGDIIRLKQLTLNGGTQAGLVGTVSAANSTLEVDGTTTVSATLHDAVTGAAVTGVTFESSDPETVSVNGTTLTAEKAGSAIITAKADGYESYVTTTVTVNAPVPEENEPLVDEFIKLEDEEDITSSYVAPSVTAITLNGQTIEAEQTGNGSYNFKAPETKGEKKFLYWAMGLVGNKRIVSFSATLENYVPEGNYRTYLVPVYEGDVAADKKEFYNQNGQLIPDADENTTVSMPGYGSTSKWMQYGDTNIYVADYEKTEEEKNKVIVTLNGNEREVFFGTDVTCTATENDGDGNPFKCWKKTLDNETVEIVSIDRNYTFKAWENCTVTAVYEAHTPIGNAMKIIIDSFTTGLDTGVMAEFIGLDDAVEKGIMFKATGATEATKIAMTTKDNQFTVIADAEGTYKGYAVVGNATDGYTLITDGLYTK